LLTVLKVGRMWMERKLIRGDYVPDGRGGLIGLDGGQEVLARVLYRLTARRGSFPFLPELGSRLYQLGREKPSERPALAAQYVAEALREETDLAVRSVELRQDGAAGRLTVYLDWQGEMLTARVTLPVL
jgi:phage gp46-like protein